MKVHPKTNDVKMQGIIERAVYDYLDVTPLLAGIL